MRLPLQVSVDETSASAEARTTTPFGHAPERAAPQVIRGPSVRLSATGVVYLRWFRCVRVRVGGGGWKWVHLEEPRLAMKMHRVRRSTCTQTQDTEPTLMYPRESWGYVIVSLERSK